MDCKNLSQVDPVHLFLFLATKSPLTELPDELASIKYLQQLTYFLIFFCEFSIISSINLRNDINKSGIIKAKLTLYQERCPRSQSSDWNKSWCDLASSVTLVTIYSNLQIGTSASFLI